MWVMVRQKQLEDLAKSLGVAEAVTFIHWIKRSELSALYRESDVFLFPSHEGAGMVVAEAMSYGLPVCVSTIAVRVSL